MTSWIGQKLEFLLCEIDEHETKLKIGFFLDCV